ncbi:MAG: NUDIX hydrolase [Bacteroidota bacterium]|jgi:8-oxo-dGTP pyrophosphatase MutT (NUDIX family)
MAQKYSEQAVTAAGGWVENSHGEVLWIHRLGRWDLPKGKLEEGEEIASCALREVEEECGLSGLKLGSKLLETVHAYAQNGTDFVKTTHWFRMKVDGRPELTPQTEEGIDSVRWMAEAEWREAAKDTYPSIQEVMRTAAGTKSV